MAKFAKRAKVTHFASKMTLPKGDIFSIEGPYLNDTNNRNTVMENERFLKLGDFNSQLIWTEKKSTNSSWDFEHDIDTINTNWVGLEEIFWLESTPTRWQCDNFSKCG